MDEFQKLRMNHLSFYLKRSLNNLSHDPIVRQMEKHRVSSTFTTERLIELFNLFIDKEREEYIEEIIREIRNARSTKKTAWETLKEEMNLKEKKISLEYEKNRQLRYQLNSIQTIADSNQWKTEKLKETSMKEIMEFQKTLTFYQPFINDVRNTASSVQDDLLSIRNDIKEIQREFDVSLRSVNVNLSEKIENLFSFHEDKISSQMKQKEIGINRSNQQLKSSIMNIFSHINNKYENDQLLLTSNSSNDEFYQTLKTICSPFPLDSEYRKASYIKNKIEDRCNIFENEWKIKIQKQQKRLSILRSEFVKAEARLKMLFEADSCIDQKLLAELEIQHSSYMNTCKNRTDSLMKMVLNDTTPTIISGDSELNLPFSNIASE